MPIFDEGDKIALQGLLAHSAKMQQNINALYLAVVQQKETMQLIIDDIQHHKDSPDSHN